MGATESKTQLGLGAHSTAKQVIEEFGQGAYLQGKVAIVTGGNSGIGLETVKALAAAGCRVVLCSRSVSAGEKAIEEEVVQPGHGGYVAPADNIVVKALDLNSLASVKKFADDFLSTEQRLDFLVCNAGIMALPQLEYTENGFERQIGVNHFGHAYLVRLLLDKMKSTPDCAGRIVVLASTAHTMGDVDPSDLHFKKGRPYRGWVSYGQSKLANILFAKGLADRLQDTPITAVSVHPGVIQTNLWRQSWFNRAVSGFVMDKTIPQGAATTVYACVCPRVGTPGMRGAYLSDCGPIAPNAAGEDEDKSRRNALWEVTEKDLDEAIAQAGL